MDIEVITRANFIRRYYLGGSIMNRRSAGMLSCFIGSLFYISRYISTAIYGSNHNIINAVAYGVLFNDIGKSLTKLGMVFFIIGFIYLISAEILDTPRLAGKFKSQ